MSTSVTVKDYDTFEQGIADVRSDASASNWFLSGHADGNPNVIEFIGVGSGGVEEFASELVSTRVMYGLVRLTEVIDMSMTTKFVFVTWFGADVGFAKRGKYGVVSGSIEQYFDPYQVSVTFDADPVDSVTEEYLMTKLQETSGTKSKVLDASEGKTRPERGFTSTSTSSGHSGPMSPTGAVPNLGKIGKQGSSFSGFTSQAKGGATVKIDESVKEYIAAVRSDTDEMSWVCAKFESNNIKKPLIVSGYGEGDIQEVIPHLIPEEVALVLLRLTDVVDDIPTVKFVYIMWVGENVKPLTKGKLPTCKGDLENVFYPYHAFIHATNHHDVRQQSIQDKVGGASGSKSNIK